MPADPATGIHEAVEKGETRTVKLSKPVPVLLTYFTAWVDREVPDAIRGSQAFAPKRRAK